MSDETTRITAAAQGQLNGLTIGRRLNPAPAKVSKTSDAIHDTLETGDRQSNVGYVVGETSDDNPKPDLDHDVDDNSAGDILDVTG